MFVPRMSAARIAVNVIKDWDSVVQRSTTPWRFPRQSWLYHLRLVTLEQPTQLCPLPKNPDPNLKEGLAVNKVLESLSSII